MTGAHLTRHFENSAQDAACALYDCVRFVAQHSHRADDIELALAEAINNVVDHAYIGTGRGTVEIKTAPDDGVHCTVHDVGRGMARQPGSTRAPSTDMDRGYGIPLMHALADDLNITSGRDGTLLSLTFPP